MLKNYLVVAFRNLWRSKLISIINLGGLILGITFTIVIMLWVNDEQKVDKFHNDVERIYNVYIREFSGGKAAQDISTQGLLAEEMKKKLSAVEHAVVYDQSRESVFLWNDKKIKFSGLFANEDFLKTFTYPLVAGKIENLLASPTSIVISKKMAIAFFGSPDDAMGKSLRFRDQDNFIVEAVFDDVPVHSSMQFEFLINWHYFMSKSPWFRDFGNTGPHTCVMLKKDADPEAFEAGIKDFLDNYDYGQGPDYKLDLFLQGYDEQYLYSAFKDGYISGGRIQYVQLFSVVAAFILIIACINFMNLSTARSLKRAREIGVRKVVGAARGTLIFQFVTEAFLLALMATGGALILVQMLMPAFNTITGKEIQLPFHDIRFWMSIGAVLITAALLAGLYPAWYISSFDPVKALKGNLKFRTEAVLFRKGLIIFQFTLSILLIVVTLVVAKQIQYVQNKNLGYERDNLLLLPVEGNIINKYSLFKDKVKRIRGVANVSKMTAAPINLDSYTNSVSWPGKDPTSKPSFAQAAVGYDFVKTMKAELIGGREFSEQFKSDSAAFMINETAQKKMNLKDPVGTPLEFNGIKGTIVGLVKDFHFRTLHDPIAPLVMHMGEHAGYGAILIRTQTENTSQLISALEEVWEEMNPSFPFNVYFTDEEYQKLYQSERLTGILSKYFSALGIVISCMGLLGLAVFSAQQRTREIGIRKVLGASTTSIFTLLSKDFAVLVVISILFAIPVSWWVSRDWLDTFEYHVNLEWWMFVLAALFALLIALITVGVQALRSAVANPVKSLRTE